MLRILFSRLGEPHIGGPKAYSFNVASASGVGTLKKAVGTREEAEFSGTGGICVRREGRGSVSDFDIDSLRDRTRPLARTAIAVRRYSLDGSYGRQYAGAG